METTQEIVDRLRAYKEKFADKYGIEQLDCSVAWRGGNRTRRAILMNVWQIPVKLKVRRQNFWQ